MVLYLRTLKYIIFFAGVTIPNSDHFGIFITKMVHVEKPAPNYSLYFTNEDVKKSLESAVAVEFVDSDRVGEKSSLFRILGYANTQAHVVSLAVNKEDIIIVVSDSKRSDSDLIIVNLRSSVVSTQQTSFSRLHIKQLEGSLEIMYALSTNQMIEWYIHGYQHSELFCNKNFCDGFPAIPCFIPSHRRTTDFASVRQGMLSYSSFYKHSPLIYCNRTHMFTNVMLSTTESYYIVSVSHMANGEGIIVLYYDLSSSAFKIFQALIGKLFFWNFCKYVLKNNEI